MNFLLTLKQAFGSIFANKMRSILSILGIVIGISSVIVMLSIWEWAKKSIIDSFDNAKNQITLQKWSMWQEWGEAKKSSSVVRDVFSLNILQDSEKKVPGIDAMLPIVNVNAGTMVFEGEEVWGSIYPITEDYFRVKDIPLKEWNIFSLNDYVNASKKVVIGAKVGQYNLNGKTDLLGKKLYIGWSEYTIIGILKEKNWNVDGNIFIPFETGRKRIGGMNIQSVEYFAKEDHNVNLVRKNIAYYLYKRSGAQNSSDIQFKLQTNAEVIKQADAIVKKLTLLLAAIGSIALVVWGIGIMNIMLVSVTERTREIGIRKAIWATKKDIIIQFLSESIVLSMIGCIIALAFSYGVARIISSVSTDFKAIISFKVVLIASLTAIILGIIFGIMPAYKAAKLKIVDTLRYE